MARPVYSTRFFQARGHSGAGFFDVPPAQVAVLRDVDAYGNMGLVDNATLVVEGALLQTIVFFNWGPNEEDAKTWRGRQVFLPGERMYVIATGTHPVDVTISGYLLATP